MTIRDSHRRMHAACSIAAAFVVAAATAAGCGKDRSTDAGTPVQNGVVFTRADTTRIEFGEGLFYVWCGPWEEGAIETETLQIAFASTVADPDAPYWWLRAVVSDVTPGEEMTFPNVFPFDAPRNVDLFLSDPPNELSSATSESSGGVTFHRIGCGEGEVIELTIDAVLGSEYADLPPVEIRGTFRAPVGRPPAKAAG